MNSCRVEFHCKDSIFGGYNYVMNECILQIKRCYHKFCL